MKFNNLKASKIFILMFCVVLLLGTVSALGFDNKLTYSNNDLKVRFENAFGLPFIGSELGTAELKSHSSVDEIRPVKLGESVVMWYEFDFRELYRNGIGGIEIINMETGEIIKRDYQFVYWGNETYEVPNYICNNILSENGTLENKCSQDGIKDEIREKWLPYNSRDISKGKITIGVEINMLMDETIDIIWDIAGKKIKKHAIVSSGAIETTDGAFTVLTYNNNGTFNVSGENLDIEILVIAGGGAGGGMNNNFAGGGGAGGIVEAVNFTLTPDNYNIIIGRGGIGASNSRGGNGLNSTFANITAIGGGGGGSGAGGSNVNGADGGSGGAAAWNGGKGDGIQTASGGDTGFGNDGGGVEGNSGGAGGGGANKIGDIGLSSGQAGGNGGDGIFSSINGTNVSYGGGGGGGGLTRGNGGIGGGGQGSVHPNGDQTAGTANTGGGGGGAGQVAADAGANGGSGIVIIRFLTLPNLPVIILNSPIDFFNTTNPTIEFNGTATDLVDIGNVTLYIDDLFNETNSTPINDVPTIFTKTLSQGEHNWTYEGCNDQNGCTNATRTLTIDSIFPTIIVTSPAEDQGTFSSGLNLSLIWSASDINIDTCQFDYEGSNTTVNCSNTEIGFFVTDSSATNLTFYVNDTVGQMSFNSTNWSYSFIENSISFNSTPLETDSQFFEINLSTSLNVSAISAQLNYNGTNFISTAACEDFCLVNNTIDIPLVSEGEFENKSFFWEISIFNGTDSINVNTSSTEQNVTRIHLEECDGTFTTETLNFTAYDEQNLSRLDPFLFDGDFDQWLGTGSVKRQSNFTKSSTSDLDLCITPTDETFFIDATIEYDEAGNESVYTLRNYYFQNDTISSVSQDIFIYLLRSAASTSFILKVQNDALLPVAGVLIETNRFYPGLNEFRIVQIAKTDGLGKSVGFFETEIVDYKFIITLNNDTLLETGLQKVIPESSPFTLTFNLGENLGAPWSSQIPLDDLISTLVWDDTSGIITYTYNDISTNLTLGRLFVIQQSLVNSSADSTICNVNSSLNSAMLTCNVGNDSGFYTASGFITRNSIEILDLQISFQIETLSAIVGFLGLFYGWFLILIASFMFKFNEIAGIWAITIVVLLVNIMGLINFGGVFVTSTIGVAVLLTWLMSN